jgi:glycosyltransferase involved in cell wall biosynthesis
MTVHDVFSVENLRLDPFAVELIYSLGDSFIVGNDQEESKLELYFNVEPSWIKSVIHGPYLMFDNHAWSYESAKKEMGFSGKKTILFFGQIRPNKGLECLIKALPAIIKRHPDAHLHISTDLHMSTPELNDYLNRVEKSGVKDKVTMVRDYIPSAEIEKVFKAADVVALPYKKISQSGVLNLAFAFKRPVVVSDSFRESNIIHGKMGYSFPAGDHKMLADYICRIFDDKVEAAKMGNCGYKYATSENSWAKAAEGTYEALQLAKKHYGKR